MIHTGSHKDGIYSEDVFQIILDYELIRSIRYPSPLSLICLETMPNLSDAEPNRSARSVFETTLNSSLRSVDVPTRHGTGYLILLPATNETGSQVVCERLLSTFKNEVETNEGKLVKLSLQIGFASHSGGPTLAREILLNTAESALQQSRLNGANTIVTLSNR